MDGSAEAPRVSVQREDFDLAAEETRLTARSRDIGAIVTFTGLVREMTKAGAIETMELEHWPGVTERALEEICREAEGRWPLDGLRVIHRYGPLAPGDRIVLVMAASRHRQAAFDACAFVMDYLKTRAPFWKKESGAEGARWVDARECDTAAAKAWETR
jgi:molybdopterin synthase catalytic subunit